MIGCKVGGTRQKSSESCFPLKEEEEGLAGLEGEKLSLLRALRKWFGLLSSEEEEYCEVIDSVVEVFAGKDEIEEEGD